MNIPWFKILLLLHHKLPLFEVLWTIFSHSEWANTWKQNCSCAFLCWNNPFTWKETLPTRLSTKMGSSEPGHEGAEVRVESGKLEANLASSVHQSPMRAVRCLFPDLCPSTHFTFSPFQLTFSELYLCVRWKKV